MRRFVIAAMAACVLAGAGCIAPRCEQGRMKEMTLGGASQQQVYEATRQVLERYFELACEDPAGGMITTRYSQSKSPEDGIVKVRAIAVITRQPGGTRVDVKVVRDRFTEMWNIWGHEIVEGKDFLGSDKAFEGRILNEIQRLLGAGPAKGAPESAGKPPVTVPPTVGPPPAVVAFPPPPEPKK